MGGSLQRNKYYNDNSTGNSVMTMNIPTLVLAGSRDGLYRISRNAESYFHMVANIEKKQANDYDVIVLKGVNHGRFCDAKYNSDFVKSHDLVSTVDQQTAINMIAERMAAFVAKIEGVNELSSIQFGRYKEESSDFFAPFLESMELEGYYGMRVPCYNKNLVNPSTPKECLKGSPWVSKAQTFMGGKLSDVGVSLDFSDNFHRVYVSTPHHLPQINNTCPLGESKSCSLKGLTVSENFYDRLWSVDIGLAPVAALEHKAKMVSRESIQWHAGHTDTNFTKDDKDHTICESINQMAIDWALSKADSTAKDMYMKHGKKLAVASDPESAQAGPTWIWNYMKYTDNEEKTQTVLTSPNMELPMNYWEIQVQGNHYCKLISVFRALEWIHVDSIKDYSKTQLTESEEDNKFLQQ